MVTASQTYEEEEQGFHEGGSDIFDDDRMSGLSVSSASGHDAEDEPLSPEEPHKDPVPLIMPNDNVRVEYHPNRVKVLGAVPVEELKSRYTGNLPNTQRRLLTLFSDGKRVSQQFMDNLFKLLHDPDFRMNDVFTSSNHKMATLEEHADMTGAPPILTVPIKLDGQVYHFEHRSAFESFKYLLQNPAFAKFTAYKPQQRFVNGERVVCEMHEGDWHWENQGNIADGGALVGVMAGSDGTIMDGTGRVSKVPFYVALSNHSKSLRNDRKSHAVLLVGFFPYARLAPGEKPKSESFKKRKRLLFQACLLIPSSLLLLKVGSRCLGLMVEYADSTPASAATSKIMSKHQFGDPPPLEEICIELPVEPGFSWPKRDPILMQQLRAEAWDLMRRRKRHQAETILKNYGIHAVPCVLEELPCDAADAMVDDPMHDIPLGMLGAHYIPGMIELAIKIHGESSRIADLRLSSYIPHFSNGFLNVLVKPKAKDWSNALKVIVGVLAADGTFADDPRPVLTLRYLVEYELIMTSPEVSVSQLEHANRLLVKLHGAEQVFVEELGKSFDFYKHHVMMNHSVPLVLRFGPCDNRNSKTLVEAQHIPLKDAYQTSSKHATSSNSEILQQIRLANSVVESQRLAYANVDDAGTNIHEVLLSRPLEHVTAFEVGTKTLRSSERREIQLRRLQVQEADTFGQCDLELVLRKHLYLVANNRPWMRPNPLPLLDNHRVTLYRTLIITHPPLYGHMGPTTISIHATPCWRDAGPWLQDVVVLSPNPAEPGFARVLRFFKYRSLGTDPRNFAIIRWYKFVEKDEVSGLWIVQETPAREVDIISTDSMYHWTSGYNPSILEECSK
ncbi:hypothetical protein HDU93_008886 [Gonapodya sp. JEL0774]|nr:hypothetical protein HDU93_008886 [Gonapodya sp. JEL0774]